MTVTTPLSHEAIDAMVEYWLFTFGGSESDLHSAGDVAQINHMPKDLPTPVSEAFSIGVTFGIRASAAILSDPFGNPTPQLQTALQKARADMARSLEQEKEWSRWDRRTRVLKKGAA